MQKPAAGPPDYECLLNAVACKPIMRGAMSSRTPTCKVRTSAKILVIKLSMLVRLLFILSESSDGGVLSHKFPVFTTRDFGFSSCF